MRVVISTYFHQDLSIFRRLINEEVRKMMGELFSNLEEELESFIVYADKLDGL